MARLFRTVLALGIILVRSRLPAQSGTPDPSFLPAVDGESVSAAAIQPDGRIVIGGRFTAVGGQPRRNVARLNADGTVESLATFNPGSGPDATVKCILIDANGGILIGGSFTSVDGQPRNHLARLRPDGSLEDAATFVIGSGPDGDVNAMALSGSGYLLIAGAFSQFDGQPRNRIAETDITGQLFGSVGTAGTGFNGDIHTLAVQNDGRILAGGSFTTVNGRAVNRIVRLNSEGVAEAVSSFNPGTGPDGPVFAIAVQPDGRILVGGDFQNVAGQNRNRIARLQASGVLESTALFNPGSGANGVVLSLGLQADGRILMGGRFSSVAGQNRGGIARLTAAGSLETTTAFGVPGVTVGEVACLTLRADGSLLTGGAIPGCQWTAPAEPGPSSE